MVKLALVVLFICFVFSYAALGEDKSGVSPNTISLPSGPGSIEGLGESFEPQLNSGSATYTVPLRTLPGRAGFAPTLGLSYNSGKGNDVLGVGWSMNMPYLQRQTDKGLPVYNHPILGNQQDDDADGLVDEADERDVIIYSNGEELVPVGSNLFRFENESEFTRFEYLEDDSWRATLRDGQVLIFGVADNSRVQHPGGGTFKWLLTSRRDLNGNTIQYSYQKLDTTRQVYCHEITYNKDMTVRFAFEARPDILSDYRPTFDLVTAFRLSNIAMLQGDRLVRRYQLAYWVLNESRRLSLLRRVTQVGSDDISTLPPAEFTYATVDLHAAEVVTIDNAPSIPLDDPAVEMLDANHDGFPDVIDTRGGFHTVHLNRGPLQGGPRFDLANIDAAQTGGAQISEANVRFADMNGDGESNLIQVFGANTDVYSINNFETTGAAWQLSDTISTTGFSFTEPDVTTVDLNNDKAMDVIQVNSGGITAFLKTNERWSVPQLYANPSVDVTVGTASTKLADMNGDRLVDLVSVSDGGISYLPSAGFGQFGDAVRFIDAPSGLEPGSVFLIDVNSDGMADVVQVRPFLVNVWINHGPLDESATTYQVGQSVAIPVPGGLPATSNMRVVDINGNGSADLFWASATSPIQMAYLDFSPVAPPQVLTSVTNGIGRTTTISYSTSALEYARDADAGVPWPQPVPFPINVISQVVVNDGLQNYTTQFNYHDGYYNGEDKEFRGFARAEKLQLGDDSAPTLVNTNDFFTGVEIEARKGRIRQMRASNVAGETFFTETYDWLVRDLCSVVVDAEPLLSCTDNKRVSFVYQQQRTKTIEEKGNGTPVTLQSNYDFDNYGNPTLIMEHGRLDGEWDDERKVVTRYSADYGEARASWILNQPVNILTTDENDTLVAEQRLYYDGNLVPGELSRANLTRQQDWVSGTHYINTVRNHYDDFGNIVRIEDPLFGTGAEGHYREIDYDDEYQTFPVRESIVVSNTMTLVVTATYDEGFGVVTSSSDFNDHQTTYGYDTFARSTSVTKPLDTLPTITYDYQLAQPLSGGGTINWVETNQRESQGGGTVDSRQFFDGLSRQVMTRAEGEFPGQIVVSDTVQFNARKTAAKNYLPYFETGSLDYKAPGFNNNFTTHSYDALGREVKMVQPDGSFSQILFEPLTRTIRDEEQTKVGSAHAGAAMKYEEDGLLNRDGQGRLRRVTEVVPELWLTEYRYDLLDNLTGYTDSQNNQKIMQYDGLSRKTFMNDPDRGHMSYVYDAASNLTRTIDAKQQTIDYQYDGSNRLLAEFYQGSTTPAVQYHYDVSAGSVSPGEWYGANTPQVYIDSLLAGEDPGQSGDANGDGVFDVADIVMLSRAGVPTLTATNTLGQLAWVEDEAGEEHYDYDARARKRWTIRQIDDGDAQTNYYSGMDYDSMDRVSRLTYPDRSYVDYQFNSRGFLESVGNVIQGYDYNPAGQNLLLTLHNGITTNYTYDIRLRLSSLKTVRVRDALTFQDLSYSYDNVSNITQIGDRRNSATLNSIGVALGLSSDDAQRYNAQQDFTYDNLYRLTRAANDSSYGTVDYDYDRIGNMIRKDASSLINPDALMDLGVMRSGGAAGASGRVGRDAGAAPGPHALTSTSKGPNGALNFGYDDNGNMTADRDLTYQWDEKDRLVGMSRADTHGSYRYDFNNSRKLKQVYDSQNILQNSVQYIDKYSEVRDGKLIKYVYAGASRIARTTALTSDNQALMPDTYYHHDHLGSTNLASDATGKVTEHLVNYPFGRSRLAVNVNNMNKSDYRFTGKERDDESGLQYFEARYLGVAGGFVSVDPHLFKSRSPGLVNVQFLNGYSYSINNPLNYKDDEGEFAVFAAGIVGGALNVGIYALNQRIENREFSGKAAFREFAVGTVSGALGVGLFSKINKIAKLSKTVPIALRLYTQSHVVGVTAFSSKATEVAVSGVVQSITGEKGNATTNLAKGLGPSSFFKDVVIDKSLGKLFLGSDSSDPKLIDHILNGIQEFNAKVSKFAIDLISPKDSNK